MKLKSVKKIFKSFTLVEILIVLTITGIISVFSVTNAPTQIKKSRDAIRKVQIDRIKKAIEDYYQDSECYPQTIPACTNSIVLGETTYLDTIACDPKTKLSYTYVAEISDCPSWYQLYANLEYFQDKAVDEVGCRNGCGPDCQFNYGVSSPNQQLDPYCEIVTTSTSETGTTEPIPETETPEQYVCSPSGSCEVFANPEISGCPDIYLNDPTCQNACIKKINTCHDDRGKMK